MKKLAVAAATCFAAVALAPDRAAAAACGLPDAQPLHIEFGDGSVKFRNEVFRRPGVVVATNGVIPADHLRAGGAHTVYWWMKLENLVGTADVPADPATVEAAADRIFDFAVPSTGCATPWIAFNELLKPTVPTPWSAALAQYRINVLTLLRRLAARGARPFLLLPSSPNTDGDAAVWWRQVAEVADLVLEVYFPAPRIHAAGAIVGSRTLRVRMRDAVRSVTKLEVPAARVGIMLGFQSGGIYGRVRLQPTSAWLRFVKLNALAARQVARELDVGTVWSWGWGTFNTWGADADKPKAACVYLWARDSALCDGPAAAGAGFNASLTEGQIVLGHGVRCRFAGGQIANDSIAQAARLTRDPTLAFTALFARLVQRRHHPVSAEALLRAEEQVVERHFRGSRQLYLAELAHQHVSLEFARNVIADELRRRARPWSWERIVSEQTRALNSAICLRDELPSPGDVRLSEYVSFLALDAR